MAGLSTSDEQRVLREADDASRDLAFASDIARVFERVVVAPTMVCAIAVSLMSDHRISTISLCIAFLMTHGAVSQAGRREQLQGPYSSLLLGPGRVTVSMLFLPTIVWIAGHEAHGWIVAVPAVFAHAFLSGARTGTAYLQSTLVMLPTLLAWSYVNYNLPGARSALPAGEISIAISVLTSTMLLGLPSVQQVWDRWWRTYEMTAQLAEVNEALRKSRDELHLAAERADQASASKTDFLTHMSHELRTPMNGVLGSLDLLSMEDLQEEHAELVVNAASSARSLLRLLDELLDLSKVEAGRMDLEATPFSLRGVIDQVETTLTPLAKRDVRFQCSLDPILPDRLVGDPTRLRQILVNLAGNALKFTRSGAVTVHVGPLERPTYSQQVVLFEVRDTGIGIAPDRMSSLFDAYTQATTSTTREYGGTGLGLALVKELVQLMGGTIRVHSTLGEGSAFLVTIPFARTTLQTESGVGAPVSTRPVCLNVLLVEDNATSRLVVVKMLEKLGHRVRVAPHGLAGVECFKQHGADVILMDCYMPRLNGFQATERIRALEGGDDVVIIGTTASITTADRHACQHAGMDGVLPKPFESAKLQSTIVGFASANKSFSPSDS